MISNVHEQRMMCVYLVDFFFLSLFYFNQWREEKSLPIQILSDFRVFITKTTTIDF
jgi:hypothetical protein